MQRHSSERRDAGERSRSDKKRHKHKEHKRHAHDKKERKRRRSEKQHRPRKHLRHDAQMEPAKQQRWVDDAASDSSEAAHERVRRAWAFLDTGDAHGEESDREWHARLWEEHEDEEGGAGHAFYSSWDGDDGGSSAHADDWFDMIAAQAAAKAALRAAEEAAVRAKHIAAAQQRGGGSRCGRGGGAPSTEEERERRERQAAAEAALDGEARRRQTEAAIEVECARARAAYASGWATLLKSSSASGTLGDAPPLCMRDFAWPCRLPTSASSADGACSAHASLPEITADVVAEVVLPPGLSPALVKKTLQAELRRWHPDKFAAKWQGRLAAEEAGAVLERAKRVSQALNELMEKLG